MITNCFSIDVEGFVESNIESIHIPLDHISSHKENYEIEKNVNVILAILDDLNIKATFFFLGRIGREIPNIVKETSQAGHEIACHSDRHVRIFGMNKKEFKHSLIYAKQSLEDVSSKQVYGFRAPDFSITKSSLWALDILHDAGFVYDSSICPTGLHDVYGIANVNPFIHILENGLIEYPVSVIEVFSIRIPFGGGGYFRLYPISLTKYFTASMNKRGHSCMLYIHPYEVGPLIPEISGLSYKRKFRHYYNCNNGNDRLKKVLHAFEFETAIDILKKKGFVGK